MTVRILLFSSEYLYVCIGFEILLPVSLSISRWVVFFLWSVSVIALIVWGTVPKLFNYLFSVLVLFCGAGRLTAPWSCCSVTEPQGNPIFYFTCLSVSMLIYTLKTWRKRGGGGISLAEALDFRNCLHKRVLSPKMQEIWNSTLLSPWGTMPNVSITLGFEQIVPLSEYWLLWNHGSSELKIRK